MKPSLLILLLAVPCGISQLFAAETCERSYRLQVHSGVEVILDGKPTEDVWKQIPSEKSFSFPWREETPPRTEFRAFLSEDTLYIYFKAIDSDIVLFDDQGERVVEKEDRVEVFFAVDPELNEYYCVEVDPLGRVMDYRASYYRQFDYAWTFEGLEAAAHRGDSGYSVEMAIPTRALEGLGLLSLKGGVRFRAGLFRAEFRRGPGGEVEERWMSWCKPDSETPDFHVPSSFGHLVVE